MSTPYITPELLINAPTGISWSTIPALNATGQAQLAEQTNICWRATHMIDAYCGQPLRATVDTEDIIGPDARLTVDNGGLARAITSRWPVIQLVGASVANSRSFPVTYTAIPVTMLAIETNLAAGLYSSTVPGAAGAGPNAVDIAPGYITWYNGRNGFRLRLQYINGWPHTSLTASAAAGASVLAVDDCTGFAGINTEIYDSQNTEIVHVVSTSASIGPGTLTLLTPTMWPHSPNSLVSSLPSTVHQAAIYAATAQALTRGSNALTVQSLPGGSAPMSSMGAKALTDMWHEIIAPYRRVI